MANAPASYVSPRDREHPRPDRRDLPEREAGDLRFFFCEWEARAGVKSNFGVMVETVANGLGLEHGTDPEALTSPERVVENLWSLAREDQHRAWASRARRVRSALQRLAGTGYDVVLYRVYGPACSEDGQVAFVSPDPIIRSALGDEELARVADLTDAAERIREDLACEEGLAREAVVVEHVVESSEELREKHAGLFWEAAGEATRLEAKLAVRARMRRCKREVTRVLEARLAGWREVMRRCIEAHRYDGLVSARISALASADRELSASAALRERLRPAPPSMMRDERARYEAARSGAVLEVRGEAIDLLARARETYLDALSAKTSSRRGETGK